MKLPKEYFNAIKHILLTYRNTSIDVYHTTNDERSLESLSEFENSSNSKLTLNIKNLALLKVSMRLSQVGNTVLITKSQFPFDIGVSHVFGFKVELPTIDILVIIYTNLSQEELLKVKQTLTSSLVDSRDRH